MKLVDEDDDEEEEEEDADEELPSPNKMSAALVSWVPDVLEAVLCDK